MRLRCLWPVAHPRIVRLFHSLGRIHTMLIIVSARLTVAILNRLIAKLTDLWILCAFVAPRHAILALGAKDIAIALRNLFSAMITDSICGLFVVDIHGSKTSIKSGSPTEEAAKDQAAEQSHQRRRRLWNWHGGDFNLSNLMPCSSSINGIGRGHGG